MLKYTCVLLLGVVLGVLSADGVEKWERKFTDPPGTPQIDVEIFLIPPTLPGPQLEWPSAEYNPCVA